MSSLRTRVVGVCHQCQSVSPFKTIFRSQSVSAQPLVQADLLKGRPYRKHPGVTNLKAQRLPDELQRGALYIIKNAQVSDLTEKAQRLSNFLWSRKRKVEDAQLRAKAMALEKALWSASQEHPTEGEDGNLEDRIKKQVLYDLRKNTYHWTPIRYDEALGLVFMASRLAGGYAAVRRALHEIKKRDSSFSPRSLLDFGSGLGTVVWASHSLWAESLREMVCVDSSGAMNELAARLLRGGDEQNKPFIDNVYFRQFLPVSPKVQSDLVVGAFALSELGSSKERQDGALTLWRKTGSYLVLVENGTMDGHSILMEARDTILKNEDKVVYDHRMPSVFAPCTHALPCPKMMQRLSVPCNFVQSYYPLSLTKKQENSQEKFSYLIISRTGSAEQGDRLAGTEEVEWGRLTTPVIRRPRRVHCQLCCSSGELKRLVVTARLHGRDTYRCARSSDWGDRLPVVLAEDEDDVTVQSDNEPS
ncbi:methyltransferase-like protein 17, mitochondrial [Clupea harengus]|uniref:Ribosome assembly protein METTL17, mitochondrial n=1 Tax=Clupea harengus TaxID=7950 RepID=A0A8M1KHS0_CLUHA|nr:methyltransferase-like protein 17, mitochondrial [Clupea harengus]